MDYKYHDLSCSKPHSNPYLRSSFPLSLHPSSNKMATTAFEEFGATTEGLHVAEMFSSRVHGKTVMVTGVNLGGIGFATSRAFVGVTRDPQSINRTNFSTGLSVSCPYHHHRPELAQNPGMCQRSRNRVPRGELPWPTGRPFDPAICP